MITTAVKPQPNTSTYGFDVTEELPVFKNRAAYEAATGKKAPAWDKSQRIKRWVDEAAATLPPDDPYIIRYWDTHPVKTAANPTPPLAMYRTQIITNAQAAVPNFPGQFSYSTYTPAPSGLRVLIHDEAGAVVQVQPVPADTLAFHSDAQALIDELRAAGVQGVSDTIQEQGVAPPMVTYDRDPNETRSILNIFVSGPAGIQTLNVGRTIAAKFANGYELVPDDANPGKFIVKPAPGHWAQQGGAVQWASDLPTDTGEWDTRPELPVPARNLLVNEQLATGGMMSPDPLIRRTDVFDPVTESDAVPARVRQILDIVKDIQSRTPAKQ